MFLQMHANLRTFIRFNKMLEQKVRCSRCNEPVSGFSYYCCNPSQQFCNDCSKIPCTLCPYRSKTVKQKHSYVANRVLCVNCGDPEIKTKCEYFFQSKCKEYYCPTCLMLFYRNYCKMIENFQKLHGSTLEMQIEMKCGCQIDKTIAVDYLRKYCQLCGIRNQGNKCIQLADQCRVMMKCFDRLTKKVLSQNFSSKKEKDLKQLQQYLQKNILICSNCKIIIDGESIKPEKNIDGRYICHGCLKIAGNEKLLLDEKLKNGQKKDQEKKAELKLQCQICLIQFNVRVNSSSFETVCNECLGKKGQNVAKVEEKKEQKSNKKLNGSDFNALECKLCFNAESTMMNKACRHLMMCEQCFQAYSQKHGGTNRLPCPLCNTVGDYFFYVAPIYS